MNKGQGPYNFMMQDLDKDIKIIEITLQLRQASRNGDSIIFQMRMK